MSEDEIDDQKLSDSPDVEETEETVEETAEVVKEEVVPVTKIDDVVRKEVCKKLKVLKANNNLGSLPTLIAGIVKEDFPALRLKDGDLNDFQTYFLAN